MVEKAYRSMKTVGAGNIALGIIMAVEIGRAHV